MFLSHLVFAYNVWRMRPAAVAAGEARADVALEEAAA